MLTSLTSFSISLALATVSYAQRSQAVQVPGDFATIQQAIDASSSGTFIEVGPGRYIENLTIIDKSLAICGAGLTVTKIQAADPSQPVINIQSTTGSGSRFEDFEIRGGTFGIKARNADGLDLDRLRVRFNSIDGVSLEDCSFFSLEETRIFDNGRYGVHQVGGVQGFISDVRAFRNQSGFVVEGVDGPIVQSCLVFDNDACGIDISSSPGAITRSNSCFRNSIGYSLSTSSDVEMTRNTIIDNMIGHQFVASSGTARGNIVNDNIGDGIVGDADSTVLFRGNVVRDNGGDGFDWQGSDSVFLGNISRNNGGLGFSVEGDNNTFQLNFARRNAIGFGIWGSSIECIDNKASQNQGTGFFISQGQGNLLRGNTAESNQGVGFHLDAQVGATLFSNSAVRNSEDGLFLASSSSNNAVNNGGVNLNGGFGIVDEGVGNTFFRVLCGRRERGNLAGDSSPAGLCDLDADGNFAN